MSCFTYGGGGIFVKFNHVQDLVPVFDSLVHDFLDALGQPKYYISIFLGNLSNVFFFCWCSELSRFVVAFTRVTSNEQGIVLFHFLSVTEIACINMVSE